MNDWLYEFRGRRDGVTVPIFWVAILLSVLVHIAVLWKWHFQLRLPSLDEPERGEAHSLVVQLAPPAKPSSPAPPPASPPSSPSSPQLQARPPAPPAPPARAAPARAAPAPPVLALNRPAPDVPSQPPSAAAPAPARAPAEDLSAYIDARRRGRAEPAPAPVPGNAPNQPPVEDDQARSERAVAANLGLNQKPSFGPEPTHGGGVFQIKRLGYSDAEFYFFGWNKDIRRNTMQLIEVSRGGNSDIRLAVVRKMIAIIREHESEDFLWESHRLGRSITLSARARDNAGLEDFMMSEFFFSARAPR